jgi:polyribonucleotide nucleotidyltransferase
LVWQHLLHLSISSIPFEGPISEVRVTKIDGQFVVNPTPKEAEKAELNVIIAGTVDNILMVEGEAKECSEADLIEAIKVGHEIIIKQCNAQLNCNKNVVKPKWKLRYRKKMKS